MPLPPADELVLNALRIHADAPTTYADQGSEWATVILAVAQNYLTIFDMEPRTFYSIIKVLTIKGFYREIDEEQGWVKMSPQSGLFDTSSPP